ncbi:SRPBCC family protein [Actinoplanes subtropicus]|uniref:SRPBCC family protein n=1 Tax=Actinoplanes subtropicus TaxID=543632 RepID=UPI00068D1DDE|nr:SRPBCC domain-containing protein [Actinoplanes subtropicus]
MTASPTVTATTRIAAPPEAVFPYFTDPALIVTWLGDQANLDPRPGGVFAVDIGTSPARGTYLSVEPPTRVVFTWGLPGNETMPTGSTTVEVLLIPDDDGTVVSLTHHDLPAEHRPGHQEGWDTFIGALPAAVTHH